MGLRNVPTSIKDPNLAGLLRELRAAIVGVSDQVTKLVQTRSISSSGGGGGGGGTDPGTNPPVNPSPGGDGYPPPAPTSLQAIPGAFSITLVWANPVIPDLQATEVWARRSFSAWNSTYEYLANAKVLVNGTVYRSRKAQDVNPTTNVVTLNKNFPPATSPDWWEATTLAPTEKSKVGESGGNSWIHDGLTPGETWAYWVRNRDIENLFSAYFPDDDVGVITTTLLDPGAYLDLLTNSITATQLYRDLGQRINLIDGPDTLVNSVNARAKQITTEFDNAISDIVDGTTDITVRTDTGYATLRALKKSTEDSSAAIGEINRVEANSTSANASRLYGVRADVYNQATGLTSKASLTQLDNAKSDIFGASVERFTNLSAEFSNKQAQINQINYVSSDSASAAARTIAALDATVNTGPDNLSGKILALNDVSATSTSANAKALFQVQASNATKISVFFQTSAPSTTNRVAGDLWYDTDDSNKQYKWNGSSWEVFRDAAKTYSQTTAPTNTTANPLYVGDLWIDTTVETVNGQSVPRNKTYRWNGSGWVDVSNGSYNEAKASALVTNLEQTKIGYSTRNDNNQVWDANGTIKDKATADAWNAGANNTPKVTWNVGIPLATAVKQVSVSGPGGTVALEQQFIAQQTVNDDLYAQYTVKIDNQGWVSGFGLASETQSDGTVISDFGIRADRFWLAPPSSPTTLGDIGVSLADLGSSQVIRVVAVYPSAASLTSGSPVYFAYLRTNGSSGLSAMSTPGRSTEWFTLKDIRSTPNSPYTQSAYWNQTWWPYWLGDLAYTNYEWVNGQPTAVTRYVRNWVGLGGNASNVIVMALPDNPAAGYKTTATTAPNNDPPKLVSNKYLPFVVTTTDRYYNGQLIKAGVYMNAAWIVDASITNAKIYGHICSDDFVSGGGDVNNPHITPGVSGWCINKNGIAVFNRGVWRNWIASSAFFSGGGTIDSAGNINNDGTAGWALDQNGKAVFNEVIVRSGKNIGVNALTWAYFYDELTANDTTTTKTFTPTRAASGVHMCWTPKPGTEAANSRKHMVVPYASGHETTIVCHLTFESPTRSRGTPTGGTELFLGECDLVQLQLWGSNAARRTITLYDKAGKDIQSNFFSSQGAFVLDAGTIAAYSGWHIRVIVRHNTSGQRTYDNVSMFVQCFVQ